MTICVMCNLLPAEVLVRWNTGVPLPAESHAVCKKCMHEAWKRVQGTVCKDYFSIRHLTGETNATEA